MAGIHFSIEQSQNLTIRNEENTIQIIIDSTESNFTEEMPKNMFFLSENNEQTILKYRGSEPIKNYFYVMLSCLKAIYQQSDSINNLIEKFERYYDGKQKNSKIQISYQKLPLLNKLVLTALSIVTFIFLLFFYNNKPNPVILFNSPLISEDILLPRNNLTLRIDQSLEKQSGIKFAILVGQGGTGKTTIAREYIQQQKSNLKWEINAENNNSIINSIYELANEIADKNGLRYELENIKNTCNADEKTQRLKQFVFSNLRDKWFLLFDNAKSFDVIKKFLPFDCNLCGVGTVLITTRNSSIGMAECFTKTSTIAVEYLNSEEQLQLFCNILFENKKGLSRLQKVTIEKLLKNIPSMPLDISIAAHYIKHLKISLKEYVKTISYYDQKIEYVQCNLLRERTYYYDTRYKIISTSFDSILSENKNFKELLLLICSLDSQNIPKKSLVKLKDTNVVDDFIKALSRQSLIIASNEALSIHRSVQKIGLRYILQILTIEEQKRYLSEIINSLTSYTYLRLDAKHKEIWALCSHLNALLNNLSYFKTRNIEKYKAQISAALFCVIYHMYSAQEATSFAERNINIKICEKFLSEYDFALLLTDLMYKRLEIKDFEKVKALFDYFDKHSIKFRKKIASIDAIADSYKGKFCGMQSDFKNSFFFFNRAMDKVLAADDIARDTALVIVTYQYCDSVLSRYLVGTEINKAAQHILNTLSIVDKQNFFHQKSGTVKSPPFFINGLCIRLANVYNRLGKYNLALECAQKAQEIFELRKKDGTHLLQNIANVNLEKGCSLLRLNDLPSAKLHLQKTIETKQKIGDKNELFSALIHLSEINIRQNNIEEAYSNCLEALRFKDNTENNFNTLMKIICYYNMAIAKYKLFDKGKSVEHFKVFSKLSNEFCEEFLEKSVREKLLKENIFEFSKNESQIKVCLQNSLKIFSAIYGENHSFVKNYVKVNAKK